MLGKGSIGEMSGGGYILHPGNVVDVEVGDGHVWALQYGEEEFGINYVRK